MQIHSLQPSQAAQSIGRANSAQPAGKADSTSSASSLGADQLELSAEAQQISQTQASGAVQTAGSDIRTEKVAALRQAIADGTYETEENLSAALDRMLDTFA